MIRCQLQVCSGQFGRVFHLIPCSAAPPRRTTTAAALSRRPSHRASALGNDADEVPGFLGRRRRRQAMAGNAGLPLPPPSLLNESLTPTHCPTVVDNAASVSRVSTLAGCLNTASFVADLLHGRCCSKEGSRPAHIALRQGL